MILKALEMQGFKSFPDKTVLEFGRGITAVVGPNGSGKSNISDAVRWVLGEQSTKTLRGAKMEDVIFGGTSQRKALGYAEVTLRLDNTDRSLNGCDKDEVAVTRRYYRSGESEYLINGEACRLRDIHELFMDTGLGRDGYSMVGQGRIADLVSARSTQRRDMLEEAAGISHFRYRRADATRRLEQAEENLVRLRDILSELEGRIGPLKTQSEKAIKFLALADEKKTLEIGLWLHTIDKSKNGLREQEHKLSVATAQYDETETKLVKLIEEIEASIKEGQDITLEIERLRSAISDSEEQAAVIDGRIAVERNTIEHNRQTVERITADMGDSEKFAAETDRRIEQAQNEAAQKEAQAAEKREALAAELQKLGELLSRNSENSEQAKALGDKAAASAMQLADIRVERSTAVSAARELAARIDAINEAMSSRSDALETLSAEKASAENALRKLRNEAAEHENALDGYRMIIDSRAGKVEKLRKELEAANLTRTHAPFAPVEKSAARGMRVTLDFEGFMDGAPIPESKMENVTVVLGTGQLMPAAEDAVYGHKAGESFRFDFTYPAEFRVPELSGKTAQFAITLHTVEQKQPVPLDDAFAKTLGFDTVDALKESIREKKRRSHEANADRIAGAALLGMAGANLTAELDNAILDQNADHDMNALRERLRRSKMTMELYCKAGQTTPDEVRAAFRRDAERKMRSILAVQAIAKAEQITVSNAEVDAEYVRLSKLHDTPEAEIRNVLSRDAVASAVITQKVQRFLIDHANITSVVEKE